MMRQNWRDLLFMHWRIDETLLVPLLPPELEIDRHEGEAWVGLIPFSLENLRPVIGPAIPGLSSFGEVNVRTYVTHRGRPGVWFFSLDASNPLAVWFARAIYHLPYFRASISQERDADRFRFTSRRRSGSGPKAVFEAEWQPGQPLGRIKPGSLAWFLTERYRLFTEVNQGIRSVEIWHQPWPLRHATLNHFHSNLIEAAGLPTPEGEPIVYHSDELAVEVWPLRQADQAASRRSLLEPEGAPKPV